MTKIWPGSGEFPKLVAVVVVVGEGAELEIVPDPVVAELDFRPPDHVSGEEREDSIRPLLQSIEKRKNSGKQAAGMPGHARAEKMQVTVQQGDRVFRRCLEAVLFEKRHGDQGIGGPGERDAFQVFLDAEPLRHRLDQGGFPGAAGSDQRAVDVEEKQPSAIRHRHGPRVPARGLLHAC